MKVVAKPVEMVAWFDKFGNPNPVRFRMEDEGSNQITIKIDRILQRAKEKLAGNNMIIFQCQSCINGLEKIYELKYELSTCKWILFKI
ncbi:hypothetical protein JMF89_13410 [Clostridiaceae bacterium UIB06]|nr:hypothetical protein [Clostridiaceae bacterium UIB06]